MNEAEYGMRIMQIEVDDTLKMIPSSKTLRRVKGSSITHFESNSNSSQVFSVNGSITCNFAALLTSSV